MKRLFLILALLCPSLAFGQTSTARLQGLGMPGDLAAEVMKLNTAVSEIKAAGSSITVDFAGTDVTTFDAGGITIPTSLHGFWTLQAATNQACETTCTNGACVFGFDAATGLQACNAAASDACLCAGD